MNLLVDEASRRRRSRSRLRRHASVSPRRSAGDGQATRAVRASGGVPATFGGTRGERRDRRAPARGRRGRAAAAAAGARAARCRSNDAAPHVGRRGAGDAGAAARPRPRRRQRSGVPWRAVARASRAATSAQRAAPGAPCAPARRSARAHSNARGDFSTFYRVNRRAAPHPRYGCRGAPRRGVLCCRRTSLTVDSAPRCFPPPQWSQRRAVPPEQPPTIAG
jgi:hypothetical protein